MASATAIIQSGPESHPGRPSSNDQNQTIDQGTLLTEVYPQTDAETDIDIIAIHGLDTKSPGTWVWKWDKQHTKPKGEHVCSPKRQHDVNWLIDSDMLPAKIKKARILTCDWPADLLQASVPTKLEESAQRLLDSIKRRPPTSMKHVNGGDQARPILFIASCLGGIILLKALNLDPSLKERTRAIVFLATPFGGTALQRMPLVTWFLRTMVFFQDKTVSALLDDAIGSSDLKDLVGSFKPKENNIMVLAFWEVKGTNLLGRYHMAWTVSGWLCIPCVALFLFTLMTLLFRPSTILAFFLVWLLVFRPVRKQQLVDESSARAYHHIEGRRLNRNHLKMNKFCCPDCPDYNQVADTVTDFFTKIVNEQTLLQEADTWVRDKNYTTARLDIKRLSGDFLSMDQCYINLAIIKQQEHDAGRPLKGSTINKWSLRPQLKIETPDKEMLTELPAIFNGRARLDGQKMPRRILIRGRAGVGKTTLCKKIVHSFIRCRMWNELFDRILWVPLRKLKSWKSPEYNLGKLFHREYFSGCHKGASLAEGLWRTVEDSKRRKTLFVLDGLDEVARDLSSDDDRFQLLTTLLNQPNVIITSRPYGALPNELDPLDLELEVIGFYPQQVTEYIKSIFKDPQKVGEIQSFLRPRLLLQSLVRIPILLDALCSTWDEGIGYNSLQTMTAIYQGIELHLWKKDILKLEKKLEGAPITMAHLEASDRTQIEDFVKDEIYFLEGLAFTGLYNDVIDFEPSHWKHIAKYFKAAAPTLLAGKTLPRLSFLRASDPSAEGSRRSYHFLHYTFQEYFAARYFARKWAAGERVICLNFGSSPTDTETEEFLRKRKYNPRYGIFWRFVVGLVEEQASAHVNACLDADQNGPRDLCLFFKTIQNEPRDHFGPVHQRLIMHCLSEVVTQGTSDFTQVRENLEDELKRWLLFECSLRLGGNQFSRLAAEMEFPEKILEDLLQKGTEDVKVVILRSMGARPIISPAIMEYGAARLADNGLGSLKKAALAIFGRPREGLPEMAIQSLVELLQDPASEVWSKAAEALMKQSAQSEMALHRLLGLLRHSESSIRLRTAEILSRQPVLPETALQALVKLFEDPKENLEMAALALSQQSELPERIQGCLIEHFENQHVPTRGMAAKALSGQSKLPEKAVQKLIKLLDDKWFVSEKAAATLGQQSILSETALKLLQEMAGNRGRKVCRRILFVLGQQSKLPESVLLGLVELLQNSEPMIRHEAARAFSQQSQLPATVLERLQGLLKSPKLYVRSCTAYTLGQQSSLAASALDNLIDLHLDQEEAVRSGVVYALGQQLEHSERAFNGLMKLLQDRSWKVRRDAVRVLCQPKLPDAAVQALTQRLTDRDFRVRAAAIYALRQQSELDEITLQTLAALLQDSKQIVQFQALQLLSRHVSKTVLQSLESLLTDTKGRIRSVAVEALSRASPLSKTALRGLMKLLKDPEWYVRALVADAFSRPSALTNEDFHSSLLEMDDQCFNNLYSEWLRRSFSEHLTWSTMGSYAMIDLLGGTRKIPISESMSRLRKAQESRKRPYGPERSQQREGVKGRRQLLTRVSEYMALFFS